MKTDSFHKTITEDTLVDISKELIEASADNFLKDGFLKEIPLTGSILSIYKLCQNYTDYILAKKLFKFLFELKDIDEDERKKFINKIDADERYSERVTDQLILHLDKFTETNKAVLLGKLFNMTIKGKIEYYEFMRLSYILNSVFVSDLKYLSRFDLDTDKHINFNPEDIMALNVYLPDYFYNLGLLRKREKKADLTYGGTVEIPKPVFSLTTLGEKLLMAF